MRAASKDTDPAPTMTCSALTENRVARCSRSVSAVASGDRLSWAALPATACSTDGRGGDGGGVRVAIEGGGAVGNRLQHRRQWREGVFVARELGPVGGGEAALSIGGQR